MLSGRRRAYEAASFKVPFKGLCGICLFGGLFDGYHFITQVAMRRIRLTIAYDGTEYCGWQRQEGVATIEGTVAAAITRLTGEQVELIGASRTDTGVHALGNVAAFDTLSTIPGERFMPALNSFLPEDIRVVDSAEVSTDFHPRFAAHGKQYEYRIVTGRVCSPLVTRYAAFMREELDTEAMRRMARYAVGTHDFSSFCAAGAQVQSKVRTIFRIEVEETTTDDECREIRISVEGDGFLYNMVRILVGTLLQAGLHRSTPEAMKDILEAKDRTQAGPTAPAKGLRLCKIWYLNEP